MDTKAPIELVTLTEDELEYVTGGTTRSTDIRDVVVVNRSANGDSGGNTTTSTTGNVIQITN